MVDVITPTVTVFPERKYLYANFEGFNAATEYGIVDVLSEDITFMPRHCTALVTRTSGAEDTIDIDVDISWDGTLYIATDCNNITGFGAYGHHPAAGAADDNANLAPRYWKVYVVDEGTNNVNQVELWLYGG